METTSDIDLNARQSVYQLLEIAKLELKNLYSGEVFVLSELFHGYIWKRIPPAHRKLFGRYFLDYIMSGGGDESVEILDKTRQHQQIYSCK